VVVGEVERSASGNRDIGVLRLTETGLLDTSFNKTGKVVVAFDRGGSLFDSAHDVAIDPYGRVVVAGLAETAPGSFDMAIVRLTATGSLDASFDGDGRQTVAFNLGGSNSETASAVAIDASGRIVLGGTVVTPTGSAFAVSRLTLAGALDLTFDLDGRQTISFNRGDNIDSATDLALDRQGRIIIVGNSNNGGTDNDFAVARLSSSGALDMTFNGTGRAVVAFNQVGGLFDTANSVAIDREGRIVLAGVAEQSVGSDIALARIDGGDSVFALDASGDDTPTTVFRSGAVRVSYNFARPPSSLLQSIEVLGIRQGVTRTLATFTESLAWTDTRLINLATVPNLASGAYQIQVRARLANGSTLLSGRASLQVLAEVIVNGSLTGETLSLTSSVGTGTVVHGGGGTDTLDLAVSASSVKRINGVSLSMFTANPATARQAIHRGSAHDFVLLTDGREIYFHGIERLRLLGGQEYDLTVRPNDPEYVNQWNLHVTDVPGAWRFSRGANNVLLVSLDSGVLVPSGGSAQRAVRDLSRLLTDPSDDDNTTDWGHGHAAVSVLAGTANNSTGVAGINWTSPVLVNDVYNGVTLQQAIQEAIDYARSRGMRIVFQGGFQGDYWLTSGGSQADLEALLTGSEDVAVYAIAVGNGNQSTDVTTGLSAGVARLQGTHENVIAVGALAYTPATVNGLQNAATVDRAAYSNFGPDLTLSAPTDSPAMSHLGLTILPGTSAANPNTAGIASLVWSVNPFLTGTEVRQVIVETVQDIGTVGRDDTYGHGLVNADAAVRRAAALFRDKEVAELT
jgi:uncharacterized delta-60 repeat protein